MKRVEQIRVQQAEIKLKSSGVRSKMPIWTHVKRSLEKERGRKRVDIGRDMEDGENRQEESCH